MNPSQILNLSVILAILSGVAVSGWFAGAELLADQPEAPMSLMLDSSTDGGSEDGAASVAGRVRVGYDPAAHINSALVLGASGLSPFGQPEGLLGRQVLAGRVLEVREEIREVEASDGAISVRYHTIMIDAASGPSSITIRPDSTFLLGLGPADPSEIKAGAAVALLIGNATEGEATAVAALVLPADSRPVLNSGLPPVSQPAAPPPEDAEASESSSAEN